MEAVTSSQGDPTVVDYLCECLADFEFGQDGGAEVFESFGAMMVRIWPPEIDLALGIRPQHSACALQGQPGGSADCSLTLSRSSRSDCTERIMIVKLHTAESSSVECDDFQ